MKKVILIGARLDGHAGVVLDLLISKGEYKIIGFLDNTPELKNTKISGIPVLGSSSEVKNFISKTDLFHISLGNNYAREKIANDIINNNGSLLTLIHNTAIISKNVNIGDGSFIGPGTIINYGSSIGICSIINSGAIIEHDNVINDFVHIAPGVVTGGRVSIENKSFIGLGSSIIPDIRIGKNVLVGAGSTVVKDVEDKNSVLGYAAKPYYKNKNIYSEIKSNTQMK